jgi:hypothetical protein
MKKQNAAQDSKLSLTKKTDKLLVKTGLKAGTCGPGTKGGQYPTIGETQK